MTVNCYLRERNHAFQIHFHRRNAVRRLTNPNWRTLRSGSIKILNESFDLRNRTSCSHSINIYKYKVHTARYTKVHETQNRSGIYRYFEFPTLASCVRFLSPSLHAALSLLNPIGCCAEFQRNGLRIRLSVFSYKYCIFMFRPLNIFGFTKLGRE